MNYIYKIVCKDLNVTKCYIGSTTNLNKRMALHKYSSNNFVNLPLYDYMNQHKGFDNFEFIILCQCNSTIELKQLERFYIELHNSTLNVRKSYTSQHEKDIYYKQYTTMYNQRNKNYFKSYYLNNKEKYNKKIV